MHDLVIRGGTIVDGLGSAPRTADVAVDDGRITEVGTVDGAARETIDADGLLVTPGFVDVHTHYDGQATWDSQLAPVVLARRHHRRRRQLRRRLRAGAARAASRSSIELMEGVEDIPGTALREGIDWRWETFPEYLDALAGRPRMIDVGTHVPHAAVRAYVMGERAGHRRRDARRPRGDGRDRARGHATPARSASRRRASSPTTPAAATRCRAPSPTRTS